MALSPLAPLTASHPCPYPPIRHPLFLCSARPSRLPCLTAAPSRETFIQDQGSSSSMQACAGELPSVALSVQQTYSTTAATPNSSIPAERLSTTNTSSSSNGTAPQQGAQQRLREDPSQQESFSATAAPAPSALSANPGVAAPAAEDAAAGEPSHVSPSPIPSSIKAAPTRVVVVGIDPDTHGGLAVASWLSRDLQEKVDISRVQVGTQQFDFRKCTCRQGPLRSSCKSVFGLAVII